MTSALSIQAEWERTDEGTAEERASFGMFRIGTADISLTEGFDAYVSRLRDGPLVSAYHAAEWFAWNWWRLRWEPKSNRSDWPYAHRMSSIGAGYVWPNITFISDGSRVVLIPEPSSPNAKPFRYIADMPLVVSGPQFEFAVDEFVAQVLDRLNVEKAANTNLCRLWCDLVAERANPKEAIRRKLEALIGAEPDEADAATIDRLEADGREIGLAAVTELAADQGIAGKTHTVSELRSIAATAGYSAKPSDAVALHHASGLPTLDEAPAWVRGAEAARQLRNQVHLGAAPISNSRLEEMAGVSRDLLKGPKKYDEMSFALDDNIESRVVLGSKWETGRRFNLARLLGDRLCMPDGGKLKAATRTYTYRQKMQRSFAAELLCPFEALEDWLREDYSNEAMENAAEHFTVSPRLIETMLANNGRIDRSGLETDPERTMATSAG
jgi:hypothetical protein